jgi:hypothetical protein
VKYRQPRLAPNFLLSLALSSAFSDKSEPKKQTDKMDYDPMMMDDGESLGPSIKIHSVSFALRRSLLTCRLL